MNNDLEREWLISRYVGNFLSNKIIDYLRKSIIIDHQRYWQSVHVEIIKYYEDALRAMFPVHNNFTISKYGDLLANPYITVRLPTNKQKSNGWVNYLGNKLESKEERFLKLRQRIRKNF